MEVVFDIRTPEICQLTCSENADCEGFSWISEDIDFIVAESCLLFSETKEEIPHENIVSGPSSCPCTVTGGCVPGDHNVLELIPYTLDANKCHEICVETMGCEAFTFLGEDLTLAHLCVLYSSCEEFDDECLECTTGTPVCNQCSFAETVDGMCGK